MKGGPQKGGRPKISLFFPSPDDFHSFFPSLGGRFVEFWVCFFSIPERFFCPKISTTFAERCISQKAFCTPKKGWHPPSPPPVCVFEGLCGARVLCDLVLLHLCKTAQHAPQQGWSAAPLECVQIVRGRRPESELWPLAPGHSQYRTAKVRSSARVGVVRRGVQRPDLRSSRSHCRAREEDAGAGQIRGIHQSVTVAGSNVHWRLRRPRHRNPKKCAWHVRSWSQRSSSRGCLLQTRKSGWLKLQDAMDEKEHDFSPLGRTTSRAPPEGLSRLVRHLPCVRFGS